jgi:hypothetical protein
MTLLCALLAYSDDATRLIHVIPIAQTIVWSRAQVVLDFSLAVLAGFGLDALTSSPDNRRARSALLLGGILMAVVLTAVWIGHVMSHMPAAHYRIQSLSFRWPALSVLVLLLIGMLLSFKSEGSGFPGTDHERKQRRLMLPISAVLLVVNAGFLLTATPGLWSSGRQFFPTTPAVVALESIVGHDRVGLAKCSYIRSIPDTGIVAEANSVYGVAETWVFDPIVPSSYFRSYYRSIGTSPPSSFGNGLFCPSITSASLARHFGVSYILAGHGTAGPPGTDFVRTLANEDLYRVPGAGLLTLEAVGSPQDSSNATVVRYSSSDPAAIHASLATSSDAMLYIHVTNFAGWTASLDGHPLALENWGGTMLSARVPPGAHHLLLRYSPASFRLGLILAGLALLGFVFWLGLVNVRLKDGDGLRALVRSGHPDDGPYRRRAPRYDFYR